MSELIQIVRYQPSYRDTWNDFLTLSCNATFLFHRDYMEYHQDIFRDHSLLFFDSKMHLAAVLPANEVHTPQKSLISHQGLTYGGFIFKAETKFNHLAICFQQLMDYLREHQFHSFLYKPIPSIYTPLAGHEDKYLLHHHGATIHRRQFISVVNLREAFLYQNQRVRHIKKAEKAGVLVEESKQLEAYWAMLCHNLEQRHQSKPVHTLEQISRLQSLFPENIKLYVSQKDNEILAGILIYETPHVARTQYIASTEEGRTLGAMDLLIDRLLTQIYPTKLFFDFGSSHSSAEYQINKGLLEQKEGFGARAFIHDMYELTVHVMTST